MNHKNDDGFDKLLRDAFDGPVADGGFSDRVMQALPPRRRASSWMLVAAMSAAGAIACWLALGTAPVLRAGWHDWLHRDASSAAIILFLVVVVMSLLGLGWGLAEVEDREGQGLGAPR
ncbi:hypothetical protein [Solilutibacter silvestris]|uniref:hypothetical protein n=1 Tax=Solilutibacter silvestris TaxID=1645665 RepID=UPI003D32DF90